MRFVTVRDLRGRSAEVWRELSRRKELVITSKGKPIALLSAVSEDSLEDSLTVLRRARATAAVEAMQRRSLEAGADRIKPREIDVEITAVRKERAK